MNNYINTGTLSPHLSLLVGRIPGKAGGCRCEGCMISLWHFDPDLLKNDIREAYRDTLDLDLGKWLFFFLRGSSDSAMTVSHLRMGLLSPCPGSWK